MRSAETLAARVGAAGRMTPPYPLRLTPPPGMSVRPAELAMSAGYGRAEDGSCITGVAQKCANAGHLAQGNGQLTA